jgi:DNA-directed RNA polymerase specialized sigma24 family protein
LEENEARRKRRFTPAKSMHFQLGGHIVTDHTFREAEIAASLMRQQAWFEAENHFSIATTIDRDEVMKLREGPNPLTLREIGKRFGCSYETVRRLISTASTRKYQKLKS